MLPQDSGEVEPPCLDRTPGFYKWTLSLGGARPSRASEEEVGEVVVVGLGRFCSSEGSCLLCALPSPATLRSDVRADEDECEEQRQAQVYPDIFRPLRVPHAPRTSTSLPSRGPGWSAWPCRFCLCELCGPRRLSPTLRRTWLQCARRRAPKR
eukprot:4508790-Alexandrium_andersonii.AAC.1